MIRRLRYDTETDETPTIICQRRAMARVFNHHSSPYPLIALLAPLFILCLPLPLSARTPLKSISIPDQDLLLLISHFRSADPARSVASFRRRMPQPVTDPSFRSAIHSHLPPDFTKLIIDNPELIEAVRLVLKPVLDLYARTQVYDLLLIDTRTPLMMADSGVVLMISTGLIERADSDDVLLGYAAHEVGHEFLVQYSVAVNHLQRMIVAGGQESLLVGRVEELLAIIELECDAFAALTLASIGHNAMEFIKSMERESREYGDCKADAHPVEEQRRRVVEGVVGGERLKVGARRTEGFVRLKQMLAHYRAVKLSH